MIPPTRNSATINDFPPLMRATTSTVSRPSTVPTRRSSRAERARNAGRDRLLEAIGRGELFLEYQSMIGLASDNLTCVEALVRWHHPVAGTLQPNSFIPAAEADGSIDVLGLWVLDQACADRRRWLDDGFAPFPVAVNLSPRQLLDINFTERVQACLKRHALPPSLLRFELTETAPMPRTPYAARTLETLASAGIDLCIDDFSMGHASVLALSSDQFRQIKIPRELVAKVSTDSRTDTVVELMIELGHRLGLTVIAEGVETTQQLAFLRERRCDDAQGFLFGRAVEAARLVERLVNERVTRPMIIERPIVALKG